MNDIKSRKILIVSSFYNREKNVEESVNSVVDQLSDDMLAVFVDDGSTDKTYEKLKKFDIHDNVVIIRQANLGMVKTFKSIIGKFDSEYIAIHGAGDISLTSRFVEQANYLDNNLDVVCLGCKYIESNVLNDTEFVRGTPFKENYHLKVIEHNPFTHGEVMFRREAYENSGGYRDYFTYAQDRDLWCRMSRIGKFACLDSVLYQRYSAIEGSVTANASKLLKQRYYSAYAISLHEHSLADSNSHIYDEDFSPLLFSKRGKLVKSIVKYLFSSLKRKRNDDAKIFFSRYVVEEKNHIRKFFIVFIFHVMSFLNKTIRK
ncbi:hypothetical protein BCS95_15085 [Vibrio breoganii]|uniref:glycosyltransferase family 2 protein n=1 Tax=Vibrio breoganii TaxID=553239 RepID=UPI000C84801A|nr:glycosyltransferase [Vibrio breoganii]PMP00969.1 hypothetical protein BCS95_15085 [Vibrio breoganii]